MILGCGYVGERLAAVLRAEGHEVVMTTRDPARAATLGSGARVVDPDDPRALEACFTPGCIVVDSVPVTHAVPSVAPARVIYLSSTGVYGSGEIDEDSPVIAGNARLAQEAAWVTTGSDLVILRIAAIYGPGRGVHERLRTGAYRVPGDGSAWVSRIHVDDLVQVIVAAGMRGRGVYVVADDRPTTLAEHADGVAAALGLPPPPRGGDPQAHVGSRRVRNARMKAELAVSLRYPDWRAGLWAILHG